MIERFEPCRLDAAFGLVEIVDDDADMIERTAFAERVIRRVRAVMRIERQIELVVADMDRSAAADRRPLPADMPANRSCISLALRSGSRTVMLTCSMKVPGMDRSSNELSVPAEIVPQP